MLSPVESRVPPTSMPARAQAGAEDLRLTGRLITLAEEERKHLARELHDDIGQRLSLVAVELDLLTVEHECAGPVRDKLNRTLAEIKELATDIHNLSHRLHSSKLQHLGLPIALKEVCRQMASQHRIDIDLQTGSVPSTLPEDVSLCLYRIAQEALSNAVKHSQSKRIEVGLNSSNGRVMLEVKDFGIGFDPATQIGGLGLATMQERLRMIGGTLSIHSIPGMGTELIAEARMESSRGATTAA